MDRTAYSVRDAALIKSAALPNGAASTNTAAIDLGPLTGRGLRDYRAEVLLEAPALTQAAIPDTKTMTYKLQADDNADFSTAVDVAAALIVQAGSTGAAEASARWRIPSDCKRYLRAVATNSGAGNASAVSMSLSIVS